MGSWRPIDFDPETQPDASDWAALFESATPTAAPFPPEKRRRSAETWPAPDTFGPNTTTVAKTPSQSLATPAPPEAGPNTTIVSKQSAPFGGITTRVEQKPETGLLGSGWGMLTPEQGRQELAGWRRERDRLTRELAAWDKQHAGKAEDQIPNLEIYRRAGLRERLSAFPTEAQLTAMETGAAPLPTKTAARAAVEMVPRGLAEATLSVPEFVGIAKGYLGPGKVDDDALYRWARGAKDYVAELFPGDSARQDHFGQQLASGLGQIGAFYGAGFAAQLARLGPKATALMLAAMGSSMGGAGGFEEATQNLRKERARAAAAGDKATVDETDRLLQTLGYAAIGATEALPIVSTLGRVVKTPAGAFGRRALGALESAAEEAAQESGSQLAQNIIAQRTTEPGRETTAGVARAGAVGGLLGGLAGGLHPGRPAGAARTGLEGEILPPERGPATAGPTPREPVTLDLQAEDSGLAPRAPLALPYRRGEPSPVVRSEAARPPQPAAERGLAGGAMALEATPQRRLTDPHGGTVTLNQVLDELSHVDAMLSLGLGGMLTDWPDLADLRLTPERHGILAERRKVLRELLDRFQVPKGELRPETQFRPSQITPSHGLMVREIDPRTWRYGTDYAKAVAGEEDTQKLFLVHPNPRGLAPNQVKRPRQLGEPMGYLRLNKAPDGRWNVDMVEVFREHARTPAFMALMKVAQDAIGTTLEPAAVLLPDGYRLASARDPRVKAWWREDPTGEGSYLSPKEMLRRRNFAQGWLWSLEDRLAQLESGMPEHYAGELERTRGRAKEVGEGLKKYEEAYAKLPAESKTVEALQEMMALERSPELDELGLYSKALEVTKSLPQQKGTRGQFFAMLEKAGVRAAEIEVTGLDEFLLGGRLNDFDYPGKDANRTLIGQLEERIRAQEAEGRIVDPALRSQLDKLRSKDRAELLKVAKASDVAREPVTRAELEDYVRENRPVVSRTYFGQPPEDWWPSHIEENTEVEDRSGEPQYQQRGYTLAPENKTYRESLLYLDPTKSAQYQELQRQVQSLRQIPLGTVLPDGRTVQDTLDSIYHQQNRLKQGYGSPETHFEEVPDILSHRRTFMAPVALPGGGQANDLVIDEIQSDWGQAVREEGARDEAAIQRLRDQLEKENNDANKLAQKAVQLAIKADPLIAGYNRRATEIANGSGPKFDVAVIGDRGSVKNALRAVYDSGVMSPEIRDKARSYADDIEEYRAKAARLRGEIAQKTKAAPSHPLVNTTDQWIRTQVNDLISEAVRREAEGISLTPGVVQSRRWGQSKYVRELTIEKYDSDFRLVSFDEKGTANFTLRFDESGYVYESSQAPTNANSLANVLGKEIADRVLNSAENDLESIGDEIDIPIGKEIGGEGMRYMYDTVYPRAIDKALKSLDPSIKREKAWFQPGGGTLITQSDAELAQKEANRLDAVYRGLIRSRDLVPRGSEEWDSIQSKILDISPKISELLVITNRVATALNRWPLTDTARKAMRERGLPMMSMEAAAQTAKQPARTPLPTAKRGRTVTLPASADYTRKELLDHVERLIKNRNKVNVAPEIVAAAHAAIRKVASSLPAGVPAVALTRIEPSGERARWRFTSPDGSKYSLYGTVEEVRPVTASYISEDAPPMILLLSIDASAQSRDRLVGELRHEAAHALRRQGYLTGVAWDDISSHARSLDVMGIRYRDFRRAINDPNWHKVSEVRTLGELYREHYAKQSPEVVDAILEEEGVAHLVQLAEHGVLTPEELAPVQDVLEAIRTGALVRGEAPAGGQARMMALEPSDYRGQHSAPDAESGAPIHDVTSNGIYPSDFYGSNGLRYYGTGSDLDNRAYQKILSFRDKPDERVVVWRAIPKVSGKKNKASIAPGHTNPGDWVTIIRDYAVDHGESALNGEYNIVKNVVRAGDLYTSGDSFLEWGWSPKNQPTFDFDPTATAGSREAIIGDTTLTYGVGKDGLVELILIETPKSKRGEGSARKALEAFLIAAGRAGLRVGLNADPMDIGISKPGLEKFYKSLGFRRNVGKKRDFSTRLEYIREPD